MLRQLEKSHDNVIGFSLGGEVTEDEHERGASLMRDAIAQHGKIRVLFRLKDLSLKTFINDLDGRLQFVRQHGDDIERVAIVSDDAASGLFSKAANMLPDIEVEHFDMQDEDKAWAWME